MAKKCVETYSLSNAAALNLREEELNKHEHTDFYKNKNKTKRITKAQKTDRRRIINISRQNSLKIPLKVTCLTNRSYATQSSEITFIIKYDRAIKVDRVLVIHEAVICLFHIVRNSTV